MGYKTKRLTSVKAQKSIQEVWNNQMQNMLQFSLIFNRC